jgi:hypothetical protein
MGTAPATSKSAFCVFVRLISIRVVAVAASVSVWRFEHPLTLVATLQKGGLLKCLVASPEDLYSYSVQTLTFASA